MIDASYAISPLKPLTHFLNLGTLVGVFPAESGDRKIRFVLAFSAKLIWAILFTILWLGVGVGVATYCCMYNSTSALSSAFYVSILDILFSSNHNIHKSSFSLSFWASGTLIERFYEYLSIKGP